MQSQIPAGGTQTALFSLNKKVNLHYRSDEMEIAL